MIILRLFVVISLLAGCAVQEQAPSVYFCSDDRLYYDYGYKIMQAAANCEYLTIGTFEEVSNESQGSKEIETFDQTFGSSHEIQYRP